jgi:hypothetical protein
MLNQHPITPPLELVHQWADMLASRSDQAVFTMAAQWGADQELEECCKQLKSIPSLLGIPFGEMASNALRAARRPKPPSLKEQALAALEVIPKLVGFESERDAIRAALEALPND